VFHRIDKLQELFTARQRELLRAYWHALELFCRVAVKVAVNNGGLNCHLEHMPQSPKRVVIPCGGRNLTKRTRPLLTIRFGYTPDFPIPQARPAFQQGNKNLIPVVSRCRFDRHVIGLILLMSFERFAKSYFGGDFPVAITDPLAMVLEKFRELGFGYAVMRCLERLPNFFAASKTSGIIAPRVMAEKIRFSGFLPCFRGFA